MPVMLIYWAEAYALYRKTRKMDLQEVGCGRALTGSIWLRIVTGGGTYQCGNKPSGPIHLGISGLAENRLSSLEGLCSME